MLVSKANFFYPLSFTYWEESVHLHIVVYGVLVMVNFVYARDRVVWGQDGARAKELLQGSKDLSALAAKVPHLDQETGQQGDCHVALQVPPVGAGWEAGQEKHGGTNIVLVGSMVDLAALSGKQGNIVKTTPVQGAGQGRHGDVVGLGSLLV